MDINNTTGLLTGSNQTGLTDLSNLTVTATGTGTSTASVDVGFSILVLIGSWILLTAVMYVIAPFMAKFADQRSRAIYSVIYALPFAIIFALGLGGAIAWLSSYSIIISLIFAVVVVFALVMFQNYFVNMLVRNGTIRMEAKNAPPARTKGGSGGKNKTVKGKRK